jgi:hypothetical protein
MAEFLADADGDEALAISLYEWNAELSGAFMEVVHHMEVLLRNHLDATLADAFPDNPQAWYLNPAALTPQGIAKAREAIARIRDEGKQPTHGRVIAALGYGFWDALFSKKYAQLWVDVLRDSFSQGPAKRSRAAEVSSRTRLFRNRLAHHERILHIDLEASHTEMLQVVRWIDHRARNWIAEKSRVLTVLDERPN